MFKLGQKVVCKDVIGSIGLIKNKIYTIRAICDSKKQIGQRGLILEETSPPSRYIGYKIERFEPLKYDIIPNKDIIKEVVDEKADVEIKELETEDNQLELAI